MDEQEQGYEYVGEDGLEEDVGGDALLQGVSDGVLLLQEQVSALQGEIATLQDMVPVPTVPEVPSGEASLSDVLEVIVSLYQWFQADDEAETPDNQAVLQAVQEINATLSHSAMSTPFSDYTVLECLLLVLVLFKLVEFALGILREGFRWLSW
jgi:hypothetical protein